MLTPKILPLVLLLIFFGVAGCGAALQVGFYNLSCPAVESIISAVVREAARANPQTPSILLRLQFHDCFVDGCDGSILLDSGENPEQLTPAHTGVRGFDVIDQAKAKLEEVCQRVGIKTASWSQGR